VQPRCEAHLNSAIKVVRKGNLVVVVCEATDGSSHQIQLCASEDFDAEQRLASVLLDVI
jgi:hypothetical protein